MSPSLRLCLLGGFRLYYDEKPVGGIDTPRFQSLLAYLVLHRETPQLRSHLAFLLWPDSTEAQARGNLRKLLFDLRHALPDSEQFLSADGQTVQWCSEASLAVDIADFQLALERADRAEKAGNSAAERTALEEALALYNGDLVPGCYEDWIFPERDRLSRAFVTALERLIRLMEGQRDYHEAIAWAQRLVRYDPLHEAAYRRLMRLQALDGDRPAALRTYHTCATILARELGVGPGAATRQTYERLVKAEPLAQPIAPAAAAPFVGRGREWTALQANWQAAAAGRPRLVFVRGEAGIGKTRLMEELLAWAERQGIATASARSYAAAGGLAFAPVVTWLRAHPLPRLDTVWRKEIARLLPELQMPAPGPLTEPWQRRRLFEACARAVLGASQPLLLLIDDLHWCDGDTLDWLQFFLHFDPRSRFLVVGTARTEEMAANQPLLTLLEELRRSEHLVEIELGPLTEAESLSLVQQVADRQIEPSLAAALYEGSGGNPLFLVETVRMLGSQGGAWAREHAPDLVHPHLPLPPRVRQVIEARLAQLSPAARASAELAATIGREFSFAVLARAGEMDEDDLVRALDELWRRRIVREQGTEGYDFGHDQIREVAYAALSRARRRVQHHRVAQALEAVHAHDLDRVSGQVAAHYEQAGLPEEAIPHYFRAGEAARRIYANDEALRWYRRAVALLAGTDRRRQVGAPLYESLGDVLWLTGQHGEARSAYERALEQLQEQEQEALWRARLWSKIGNTCRDRRRFDEAADAYCRAEAALGAVSNAADADWWREWVQIQLERIWNAYWQQQTPELAERVQDAQAAVERYGTMDQRAAFFHALALLANSRERFVVSQETLGYARAAWAASQGTDNPRQMAVDQFLLGFVYLWHGDLDEAHQHLTATLQMTERIGEGDYRIRCLAYLSVLHRLRGQAEQARHMATRCLEMATAPGVLWYVGVARANLAWLAWRDRCAAQVLADGQAALACWSQTATPYPFHWLAVWPLLATTLSQGSLDDALRYARSLIDPRQQPLRDPLAAILEDAITAGEKGLAEAARCHLARAVELAQEMDYL